VPDVELRLTAAPDEVSALPGAPTRVWRFAGQMVKGPADTLQRLPGSYLGPVIRLRRGQKVRIHFANQLEEDSIAHWHGMDVPEAADGHPRRVIRPGREYVYDFEVFDRAGTYWYHPHPQYADGRPGVPRPSRFAPGAGCRRGRVVHVYYHGAGAETRYAGSMQIGFLRGVAESSRNTQTNITVQKTESITNQSVAGVVTDTPGNYAVTLS
jgi:hypothetical protein